MTEATLKEIRKNIKAAEDALAIMLKDLMDAERAGFDMKDLRVQYEKAVLSLHQQKRVYG